MATVPHLIGWVSEATTMDTPVAFMFGKRELPLVAREARAFSNIQSGYGDAEDRAIMDAWTIGMTLRNGTWVHRLMRGE